MLNAFYGIQNLLKGAKSILFPANCILCRCETKCEIVCESCDEHLDTVLLQNMVFVLQSEEMEITCAACFDYRDENVVKLVFALKDPGDRETVNYCALRMLRAVNCLGISEKDTVFTSIPRSNIGIYKFGFDQAQLVAKRAADIFSSAKYKKLLVRRGFSKEQKKLDEAERRANVSGKFRVKNTAFKRDFDGNIIIFDDVCTTGASMLECAKIIKRKYREANVYAVFLAKTN